MSPYTPLRHVIAHLEGVLVSLDEFGSRKGFVAVIEHRHDRHVRNLTTDADKAIEVAKQFVPEGAVLDGEKPELGGTKSGADPLKNQRIAFGKYNGCLVAGVAETDPDYLVWVATKGTRIEAAHRQAATA